MKITTIENPESKIEDGYYLHYEISVDDYYPSDIGEIFYPQNHSENNRLELDCLILECLKKSKVSNCGLILKKLFFSEDEPYLDKDMVEDWGFDYDGFIDRFDRLADKVPEKHGTLLSGYNYSMEFEVYNWDLYEYRSGLKHRCFVVPNELESKIIELHDPKKNNMVDLWFYLQEYLWNYFKK